MSKVEVNQISSQCGSTLTIGQSGDTVTLASGATQSGFGRTGTVDWDTTAKTASFTAVSGEGYFCNTTSSAFTATLPAGSAGAIVSFADYAATWQTNNLTVTPNGTDKIGGVNNSVTLSTKGQSVTFVYIDSTQGWLNTMDSTSNVRATDLIVATGGTETTCGDYKIHTFTSPGTFCVAAISSCAANNEVSYIVVAGGAGGGGSRANGDSGGGGGAGGFRESKSGVDCYSASPLEGSTNITVTATAFPITVGAGGTEGSGSPSSTVGGSGSNSVFSTITSAGGGGGATFPTPLAGNSGGSGGGGSGGNPDSPGTAPGGSGNSPPVSPAQGNPGGCGSYSSNWWGGGGGGATQAGTNSCTPGTVGDGGDGAQTSINATATYYAGGGGSGNTPARSPIGGGSGGLGGGGDHGAAGTTNTGGGGGGGDGPGNGGAGGSGIVIIRYKYQ